MDAQRDLVAFRKLMARLCETMGKPITDELVESWWKALRNVDLEFVARRVDDFLARSTEGTRFPRPAQFRPANLPVPATADDGVDYVRGYWRSMIVHEVSKRLGFTFEAFEPVLVKNSSLARAMRDLLDELCEQDRRTGRTEGMSIGCIRRCADIVGSLGMGVAA